MSRMIKTNTAELTGMALDWAVTKACGLENNVKLVVPVIIDERNQPGIILNYAPWQTWSPSSDWSQGGPLIDKHIIALNQPAPEAWWAHCEDRIGDGPTALTAACRAIVAAKIGDTVPVPAELVTP